MVTWAAAGLAMYCANPDEIVAAELAPLSWAVGGLWIGELVGYLEVGLRRGPAYKLESIGGRVVEAHSYGAVGLGVCLFIAISLGPLVWAWVQTTTSQPEVGWDCFRIGVLVSLGTSFASLIAAASLDDTAPAKVLMVALVLVQVASDFASCIALGSLLGDSLYEDDDPQLSSDTHSPFALKIGYSITALGFLFFFGPYSMLEAYRAASDESKGTFCGRSEVEIAMGHRAHCKFSLSRALVGIGGASLFVGWLYVMLGGVLLGLLLVILGLAVGERDG